MMRSVIANNFFLLLNTNAANESVHNKTTANNNSS